MPNGKPGDHPITDILNHHTVVFSRTADNLIREISLIVPNDQIDEYVNWQNPPPIEEFEVQLKETLKKLRLHSSKD